ncbi:MAG: murein biosynthesis protein MurJ [Desulfovibrio sp.]|nr:murein biosynthesis protein MurJ [Desulfovibrio sp.]
MKKTADGVGGRSGGGRLPDEGMPKTAAKLGGAAILSRLLGLVRDLGMAWLMGAGPAADALVAAMRLPHALRRLLGEGSLSMTLTAMLAREARTPDLRRALVGVLARRFFLVLGLAVVAGLFAAPLLARLLVPDLPEATRAETARLLLWCLPYVLTSGMAALYMAAWHAQGHFALPAISPIIFNIVMIAATAAAAWFSLPAATMLAAGFLGGGFVQWLVLSLPYAVSAQWQTKVGSGLDGKPALGETCHESARACLRRLPAGLAGAAAPQLVMLLAMAMASCMGAGHVAALYYAERLLELPIGIVGACIGMAGLPALSRLAAEGDVTGLCVRTDEGVRLALLLALPAAAGLWAVGEPLVAALFGHGNFDGGAIGLSWRALAGYLPALPACAAGRVLLAACNALGGQRDTAVSAFFAVAATVVFWLAGAEPPLAASLGLWAQTAWLRFRLGRRLAVRDARLPRLGRVLAEQALAAGLAAGAARVCIVLFPPALCGTWSALTVAIAAAVIVWLCFLYMVGNAEIRGLLSQSGKSDG